MMGSRWGVNGDQGTWPKLQGLGHTPNTDRPGIKHLA
jgi:hypothetical protein